MARFFYGENLKGIFYILLGGAGLIACLWDYIFYRRRLTVSEQSTEVEAARPAAPATTTAAIDILATDQLALPEPSPLIQPLSVTEATTKRLNPVRRQSEQQ
jgi:hypothetical protein